MRWLFIPLGIIILYLILFTLVHVAVRQALYRPQKGPVYDLSPFGFEDVFLDKGRIHGVFKELDRSQVILFLHGNSGSLPRNRDNFIYLDNTGYSYLAIDYPGYGQSKGSPSEAGLYDAARTAYDYLLERGYRPDQIIVDGQSLGGAVAIDLATKVLVGKVIVASSFPSLFHVAQHHYPWLPLGLFMKNKYVSIEKVGRVKAPILFIHGTEDDVIPLQFSRDLYAAATEPKYFYEVPAGHREVAPEGNEVWVRDIHEFIVKGRLR